MALNYLMVSTNIAAMKPSKTSKHTDMKLGRKLPSLAVQVGVWQHKQKHLICRRLQKIPVFKYPNDLSRTLVSSANVGELM